MNYDFNKIKSEVSIERYLRDQSFEIRSNNRFNATWRDGDSFSCSFDGAKWCDHANGDKGGSVLDLCQLVEALPSIIEAANALGERYRIEPLQQSDNARHKSQTPWKNVREVAQYNYTDENGNPLYCKVRFEFEEDGQHKKITPYYRLNPDGSRGVKGKGESPHVLYRLPELIGGVKAGKQIFIVEGEKDVDNLHALGLVATSSKDWGHGDNKQRFAAYFCGASNVLIIADHDDEIKGTGQSIATTVRDALSNVGVAANIAYVGIGKDASDWIAEMRKANLKDDAVRQKFIDLAQNPPQWTWTPPVKGASLNPSEIPPRFGEILKSTSDADYPTYIGKARMPDDAFYSFEVSAAKDSLYAAIHKARADVAKAYVEAHIKEKKLECVKPKDLVEVQNMSIVMWLRSCGHFYGNAETNRIEDLLYFNRRSGRLLRVNSDEFSTWVSNGAWLNRADKEYLRVMAFVQDAGMDELISAKIIPQCFVARHENTVYISNGESNIVRCQDGKCEIVRNGTDGILFPCEYTLKEWRLLPEGQPTRDPFETIMQFSDLSYSDWYGKYLLRAWFLNLFACHANHTPLLLTGERNSGKTATARAIREIGGFPSRETNIDPKKEEDFWVAINGKGILFLDNIEEEALSAKWLCSAIEKVTTGGGKEVRRLYTHTSTNYKATSDIIFASKIPHYAANEGVAHRLVIVGLNSGIARFKGDELLKELLDRRDESMTWAARTIAKALVSTVAVPPNVNERYPDFGEFTLKCANVLDDYENTLRALQCGEIEKSRIVLVNDREANDIYQFLSEHGGAWEGELNEIARWTIGDLPDGDSEAEQQRVRSQAMRYAHTLKRLRRPFEACFKSITTRKLKGRTLYAFGGINELLKGSL